MIQSILKILLMVLPYLLEWADEWIRKRRREKRQRKRDAVHKRPGAWAADHFGGKLHHASKTGNANEAAEADD